MTRLLLIAGTALGLLLLAALWRLDHVTSERDAAVTQRDEATSKAASLRVTLRLQRELAADQAAIETTYLQEKQRAEDYAESLRRCLADGTCGLRVAATCARVDGAGAAAGEPDAGTPELTPAARRAYPALVAGIKTQRAQILSLQEQLITLHSKCMIGATP
ncbi:lysis system i-spanin subunit Rz [Pseudomonas sp. zbq_18]|uniref:lysis system i-spanin subunit Rz n=1 Tax=Pseudomonas sp. zbq_18 TaxID=3367251 RepID=UPI00370C9DF1